MELKNYNVYFFFLILIGVSAATYFLLKPFFLAILLASILAIILQKPYQFFVRITGGKKHLSSLMTSLFTVLTLVVVIGSIVGIVAGEAANLYQSTMLEGNIYHRYAEPVINYVNQNPTLQALGLENVINKDSLRNSVSQVSQGTFTIIQKTYRGVVNVVFLVVVVFFTLYYLLIGGKELVERIMYLSPLKDSHERLLIERFISISRATAKGALIIAIIEGSIGAAMFYIVGAPSAFILGIAIMFCSLLPVFGAGLIWLPTSIILFATGNIWQGFVVLFVGGGVISTIDNILTPKLVGKDTQMHPLIVFFATLGGIGIYGFLGFIIGPIIVALFISLWDIYADEFKAQLKKYNV